MTDIEKSIKAKIEAIGTPLKNWDVSINYGIKTGYNDAFIIDSAKREQILSNCQSEEERKRTAEIIRPILRGRDIYRYGYKWADLWLINTHNGFKDGVERIHIEDYPSIKQHLDNHFDKLESRADKGDTPYNLRNCAYLDEFSKPKIVWGNLNTHASYAIAPNDMFINAPACMIVPASNYLLSVLNSKVADYYIRTLGVVRNGGFFEYKPMFVENIPIPTIAPEQLKEIDAIYASELSKIDKDCRIQEIINAIYGLSEEEINYLQSI